MKRRNFIKTTSAVASIPFFMNGLRYSAKGSPMNFAGKIPVNERVLVLINLAGGNDGLNTLIPLDQYSTLTKVRPDVIHPENSIIKINDDLGFHSSFKGMKNLWDNEKLCMVQNVGYPLQNQSHFRSTDIWNSASDAKVYEGSGWLGRFLALQHPEFPDTYPNQDFSDPLSITVGYLTSNALQGPIHSMGMAVQQIDDFTDFLTGGTDTPPDTYAGDELSFIRTLMTQTNDYFHVISAASEKGRNLSSKYPVTGGRAVGLSEQLKSVAKLIDGGLKTQVYVVNLGGFDTHASQVFDDGLTGIHATLLSQLSSAVEAFQDDLELLGHADRVIGMTYSEFGRRIVSNASNGTDHGSAAPLFLFGNKVNPAVLGANPVIDEQVTVQDNLPYEHDFRSIYWSVLKDWFEVDEQDLESILFHKFDHIPLIAQGPDSVSEFELNKHLRINNIYPNPMNGHGRIEFYTDSSGLKVSIVDMKGNELKVISNQYYSKNNYTLNISTNSLPSGAYLLQLQNNWGIRNMNFIVRK